MRLEDLENNSNKDSIPPNPKECFSLKNRGLDSMTTGKNINSFQKSQKSRIKIKNNSIKIESINTNANTNFNINNNEKSDKRKYINTYKTFSDISTNQNETTQKNGTFLNSTFKKIYENNFLILEETINTYRECKNNNNNSGSDLMNSMSNKISRNKIQEEKIEDGIFNGDVLYFDKNGLKYGLRGKKDGYGFFGTSTHYHGKIINDYVLNINNGNNNNINTSHLRKNSNLSMGTYCLINEENDNTPIIYFIIYYQREVNKFFLKNFRKINYNDLESFIFSFGIYKRYINNSIKIRENIIICFNENQNYVLVLSPMTNLFLSVYLIKIDSFYIEDNLYNKNNILFKSKFENNGVSKIIGNKGNIKIDLQGKTYLLNFNKNENCWEIKSNNKKNEIFWIMVDKKIELTNKENVFKINSQYFKVIYN